MKATHINRVMLLLALVALFAMPAAAGKTQARTHTSSKPRITSIEVLDTLSGATLNGGACIFPSSDGTCKGAVTFRSGDPEPQGPRSTPSKPKTQKPNDDRWELGFSLQPLTPVPQNKKGA